MVRSAWGAVVPAGTRRIKACFQVVVGLTLEKPVLGDRAPSHVTTWLTVTSFRVPVTVTPVWGELLRVFVVPVGLSTKKNVETSAAERKPMMY